jgi:uncharacterized damage-inducible protein DinB
MTKSTVDRPGAIVNGLLQELEQEAQTTRRVLKGVPDNQLGWRPHERARTLGELAMHVATVPGNIAELASRSPVQVQNVPDASPANASELIPALDQSVAKAKRVLSGMDDATLNATWTLMRGDREILAMPRAAFLRSVMLNHWYHHRGQLSTYLRALGQPVPSIYGPSADENPFA